MEKMTQEQLKIEMEMLADVFDQQYCWMSLEEIRKYLSNFVILNGFNVTNNPFDRRWCVMTPNGPKEIKWNGK